MDVSKLYPSIQFPVSRGTPMISPLVKWDHSENHFVIKYEEGAAKCEWSFTVDISEAEYEYISGHLIDGK
jgi:fatty acid synthase, animal type